MLTVNGVKKSFGDLQVLKGCGVTVEQGDVIAILGPSGSGKTTFLRCLNFLEKADEGSMEFDGETFDMGAMHKKDIARLRKKTAFVFQNYNLFRNKTALENVTLGLTAGRKVPRAEAVERGREALERVGLLDRCDSYPTQLSGGQQQRVAIARALAARPEIIFFDEPTSALDPELIGEVLAVIRDLAEDGMTMLVVTHEIHFAQNVSNRVLFMENGEVLANAPTAEFFSSAQNDRIREFLKNISSPATGEIGAIPQKDGE